MGTQSYQCHICCGALRFKYLKQAFNFYRCTECKHLQIYPIPKQENLNAIYQDGMGVSAETTSRERILKFANANDEEFPLRIIQEQKLPKEAYILDVGCSFGYDLHTIKHKAGYQNVYGMELSKNAVEIAKNVLNLNVFNTLQELADLNLKFDFIYLKHNLEHHPNPIESIKQIKKLLANNGQLLIGVPNLSSINGFWGKRWEWVTPPVHIHYFSQKSLNILSEKCGFNISKFYSQRGHGLPFLKHALFFSPILGKLISKLIGNVYLREDDRQSLLRRSFEKFFKLSSKISRPFSNPLKSKLLLGEELWFIAETTN